MKMSAEHTTKVYELYDKDTMECFLSVIINIADMYYTINTLLDMAVYTKLVVHHAKSDTNPGDLIEFSNLVATIDSHDNTLTYTQNAYPKNSISQCVNGILELGIGIDVKHNLLGI